MEIKRQHIFEDILGGGSSTYHSAILTCYSFDPFFYANFFRSQLNARGIGNQLVLIDSNRLDESKEDERFSFIPGVSPYEGYTPLRIECQSGGVFHPKIGLFIGEKRVTAVIGSGNLTYSGMSYNDEAWGAFSVSSEDAFEVPILAAVWKYLKVIVTRQNVSTATLQLSWMLENSDLLQQLDGVDSSATAEEGAEESFTFVANSDTHSIFGGIVEAIGRANVKKISICAPFFDTKGVALKNLLGTFSPSRINCFVHPKEGSLPTDLDLEQYPDIHFYDYSIAAEKGSKMVHAKLIQFETTEGTILAVGSANASIQALGDTRRGVNDEADIIVKSRQGRNYLNELGVLPGEEIFDITAIKKLEKNDPEKKTPLQVVIQSCELLEDGFHIIITKGPAKDVELHFVDDYKKEQIQNLTLENGLSVIPNGTGRVARTVFITKDGERISNKCIILIKSEVERKNPDRLMAPIVRLLEGAKDAADFDRLLQYVHIEEETRPSGDVRLSATVGGEKEKSIDKELPEIDFNKKVFRNRQAALEQINDRILDRLAELLLFSGEDIDYSEMPQDEATSQKDIDSGVPEEDEPTEQRRSRKTQKEFSVMAEARGYFKKLLRHYDQISWNRPDYRKVGTGILIQKPFYIQKKTDIAYSAICIAVYEMLRIAKSGNQAEWNEMMDCFIPIVGSYLHLYREDAPNTTATAEQKMARKHKNMVVFSLLLISFWKDYGQKWTLQKLLTLNLLDSYKNNLAELQEVFAEYEKLLKRELVPVEKESVEMVHQCYENYIAFISKKDEHRGELSPSIQKAIVYRPSFGFLQLTDLRYGNKAADGQRLVTCSAIAPGFPEWIKGLNRATPSRGKISGALLKPTALVFEKE